MAFVDTTQQYRHGVLIGNWNEDAYGIQHVRDPQQSHGNVYNPASHYKTIMKASYLKPDSVALMESFQAKYKQVDTRTGAGRDILFKHDGAYTPATLYQTSYSTSWGQGQTRGVLPSDFTLSKVTTHKKDVLDAGEPSLGAHGSSSSAQQYASITGTFSRVGSYRTEHSDNFHNGTSTMALPPGTHNPYLKRGVLQKTFDQPFRKLRLRSK